APSDVTIETNQSSCGPKPATSGGLFGAPKRTAQRQPAGIVERLTTLIVKISLPAMSSGSATDTEVMSCCDKVSDSSPTGSRIVVTPGRVQAPSLVGLGPT